MEYYSIFQYLFKACLRRIRRGSPMSASILRQGGIMGSLFARLSVIYGISVKKTEFPLIFV